jgi:glucuronoarabinoxylan endo-1,4-beta-xylanase
MTSLGKFFFRGGLAALALGAPLIAAGCFGSGSRPMKMTGPPQPVAVDLTTRYQRIDGFGASSAWTAPNLSDALADQFFSPDTGIGLSLLRIQIKPDGTTAELRTAQKAVARGVKVWASPWSPPVAWKTGADTCGYAGSLIDANRQDWANSLAAFASNMAAQGVPLMAISAQNEPNYPARAKVGADGVTLDCSTGWDSCLYTAPQLVAFIRDFLGPALAAQTPVVPVMAPETQGWDQFTRFADPLMADTTVIGMLGPIATHHYAGAPSVYQPAFAANKVVWETEVSDGAKYNASEPPMSSALRTAQMIHSDLADGNVSAWHYWWLMPAGSNSQSYGALSQDGSTLALRAWAFGNWSRFVRPGFVRVGATASPQPDVYVTAFTDDASGRLVVVVINQARYDVQQDFTIAGATATDLTPWVTSGTQKLQAGAPITVADGAFSVTLPTQTVTSFVGTVTP